ncbi:MAG: phosphorylase family protein [Solirubrobacteraceae bacterium]
MTGSAGRRWLDENLGPPRAGTPAVMAPQVARGAGVDPALERIEFDSDGPEGAALRDQRPHAPPTLSAFVDIPWPEGLAPTPVEQVPAGESLPPGDVLIVTWTTDEGHALSRVMTPGLDSHPPASPADVAAASRHWTPYVKNYDRIAATMDPRAPARENYHRLGTYWAATIGARKVTLFKSDSHFSRDGARDLLTTPNRTVWEQIIDDCKPSWVITTGTAGGIGSALEVGDVVVSRFVTFDPGGAEPTLQDFACDSDAPHGHFAAASQLFTANGRFLPSTNTRAPDIIRATSPQTGVLTTADFEYDDTANTFHLKGKGDACEMGDAVLGSVCRQLGPAAPRYAAVRNVSDPEIDSSDPDAAKLANYIYEHFGRWSSVCSAIVCWAIVAGL